MKHATLKLNHSDAINIHGFIFVVQVLKPAYIHGILLLALISSPLSFFETTDLTLSSISQRVRSFFWISKSDNSAPEVLLISVFVMSETVASMRAFFNELYFLIGFHTLWRAGCCFQDFVLHEASLGESFRGVLKEYQAVSRLSRTFESAYGPALFCHALNAQAFFAMGSDRLLSKSVSWPGRLQQLKYLIVTVAIYKYALDFSYKVVDLYDFF